MRNLVCEGFRGFYNDVELHSFLGREGISLWGRSLLMHVSCGILSLYGPSWLVLIMGYKMFPYILIRGVQAKPCWIRQKLLYPRKLPFVSFLPRLGVLIVPPKSHRLWGRVVGFEKDSLASQCRRFLLWMHNMANEFFETDDFISCERV